MSSRANRRGEPIERVAEQALVRLAPVAERGREVDRDLHRLAVESGPRRLRLERERHAVALAESEPDQVALRGRPTCFVEQQSRRCLQLDDRFGRRLGETLAGPDVPRHAGPAPRIDLQLSGDERLDLAVRCDPLLLAVSLVLAADQLGAIERTRRCEHLHLLVLQEARLVPDRRLHGQECDDLQQVVLEHVADRTDRVVERAPALHADLLRHRDLHAADVAPVPDRFEQGVREAEDEEVLDGLLAEVVVDAEDVLLGEHLMQHLVQFERRCEVSTEGLLDDDAAPPVETDGRQRLGHGREHRRRDRHVVDGNFRLVLVEAVLERLPRRRVGVVALDQVEPIAEPLEHVIVDLLHVLADRVGGVLPEVVVRPVATGDADDRHLELVAALHVVERREQLALSQVAGGAEQDEGVGVRQPTR